MSDNAMLFSSPMVRALDEDRKIQTRRSLYMLRKGDEKAQRRAVHLANYPAPNPITTMDMAYYYDLRHILAVGDRIWVRENWRVAAHHDGVKPNALPARRLTVLFEAGGSISNSDRGLWEPDEWPAPGEQQHSICAGKLRPSIFLPRWASRLTLTVTDVRIQRLQDISEEDALAEGAYIAPRSGRISDNYVTMAIGGVWFSSARAWYADLWDRINGDGAWAENPWVIAYTFTVEKKNIDA